jgi:hypothetical protein
MRKSLIRTIALCIAASGCSTDKVLATEAPDTNTAQTIAGLWLIPEQMYFYPSETAAVTAVMLLPAETRAFADLAVRATSDSSIVQVVQRTGRSTHVEARRPGAAVLTATVKGVSAGVTLTVTPPPTAPLVAVAAFEMIEVQYRSDAKQRWFYAPQLRMRPTSKSDVQFITRMEFSLPGAGLASVCNTSAPLNANSATDLFHELYGDYEYELESEGRATGVATAKITVSDSRGNLTTLSLTGPIVPGGFPMTYTGGYPSLTCT